MRRNYHRHLFFYEAGFQQTLLRDANLSLLSHKYKRIWVACNGRCNYGRQHL